MPSRETEIKEFISQHLDYVVGECCVPELGKKKRGKVRDVYQTEDHVVMVATDRVSAFDCVLDALIPFKGEVLTRITRWAFSRTQDIVPNALYPGSSCADSNVIIQKRLKNVGVEFVVRGFLWGSLANAYERGERDICGNTMPNGMIRYQKLPIPLFTPTTKSPTTSENMTLNDVDVKLGPKLAAEAKKQVLVLFERGCKLAEERGLILVDTKYEFGVDEHGEMFVIDEVNTPDSSRMCDRAEWEETFPKIQSIMSTEKEKYKTVGDLLREQKDLKIKELSKQFVRDILVEQNFDPANGQRPVLSKEQSYRYCFRPLLPRRFRLRSAPTGTYQFLRG
eukprot:GHVU01155970.1.p1 GENE.GHVU01155970.1~~GHVU01155970.1.p1  ORF type:complete len:337 (-),score=51.16 GHVU01155970.1:2832-3842(-)